MIDWEVSSAIGSCISAIAAVLGLYFVGAQVRMARKSTSIQVLQVFMRDVKEHESAIFQSNTEVEKEKAFLDYLNMLETYCFLVNNRAADNSSCKYISEKIIDAISLIESYDEWKAHVESAVTSESALEEVRIFCANNKQRISSLAARRKAARI